MLYQGYAEQRRAYLQKHKRVSEYDSENLMYSVIQEVLSEEAYSAIGCAVHVSLATLVKDYELLTEDERKYARNPLTHVDFLLFNQMDKQPVLAIEVDGTGFHEVGSKQAERDIKKNSILEKCAVPLLRLRTDGSGEKEKIKDMLKTVPQKQVDKGSITNVGARLMPGPIVIKKLRIEIKSSAILVARYSLHGIAGAFCHIGIPIICILSQ